ncbi:OmpA family protein [Lysobacter sp. SG-8]|uniref:OmpA family protein n=1 Tax=Marilutibacter penaei TaxID=2759900 RepID=A0A7W3YF04_9GAMM|nr:OmpA family protein [Lysobacter penaei]MBB1088726.1 OmpA family protein [Lysobacter penaei]
MIPRSFPIACFAACLVLAACGEVPAPVTPPETDPATQTPIEPEPEKPKGFDVSGIPVSDAPLGSYPYFPLPDGYHTSEQFSSTIEAGRFPFWVGELFIGVEGRIHQANIRVNEGKTFSTSEVEQAVRDTILGVGGVEVANMEIPRSRSEEVLTRSFTQEFRNGLCWPSEPVQTYVVRRSDKDIWIHACTYGGIGAAWVIVEAENSLPDPEPLDAGGLASRLRTDGLATVPFAFQSAAADILENEAPRIDAIAEVLDQEADWRFAVSGYAGAGVGPAQAAQLADARAQAVVSALVAAGIDPDRLSVVPSADTEPSRESGRNIELTLLPAESGASAPASLP